MGRSFAAGFIHVTHNVEDNWCIVMMHCSRCDLFTDWFQVQTVTEAKRGVPCPRCNGIEFKTNQYGEYVVTDSSQ